LDGSYILAQVVNPESMACNEKKEEPLSKTPMRNTFVAPSTREMKQMFLRIDENDSSSSQAPGANNSSEQKIDSNTID